MNTNRRGILGLFAAAPVAAPAMVATAASGASGASDFTAPATPLGDLCEPVCRWWDRDDAINALRGNRDKRRSLQLDPRPSIASKRSWSGEFKRKATFDDWNRMKDEYNDMRRRLDRMGRDGARAFLASQGVPAAALEEIFGDDEKDDL